MRLSWVRVTGALRLETRLLRETRLGVRLETRRLRETRRLLERRDERRDRRRAGIALVGICKDMRKYFQTRLE